MEKCKMDQKILSNIWSELSLTSWKEILIESDPSSKWELRGKSLKGSCPFPGHTDSSPSCFINIEKKFVKCFGCGQFEVNPVKFVSTIKACSWSEAIKELKDKGVKSLPAKITQEIQQQEIAHNIKSSLAAAANSLLCDAFENRGSPKFAYCEPLLSYLESRGVPLSKGLLQWLPIGVMAPWVQLKALVDYPEKTYEYIKDWLTADYVGSLVFYYHTTPNEISRFKLRADFLRKDTSVKDIVYVKDAEYPDLGFFGLSNYRANFGVNKSNGSEVILVEGEFDCISHLINFYSTGVINNVVLGVGGAAASSPDKLRKFGVDKVLLMTDHPTSRGNEIAMSILSTTDMACRVFTWPESVKAKDPDEAIKKHGWDAWVAAINYIDSSDLKILGKKNFSPAHRWLAQVTSELLESVDKDDLVEVKRIVSETGACLKDCDVQRLYAIEVARYTPLSMGSILELILGHDTSESGLVARIIQALKEQFFFIGMDGKSTEATIRAWNRSKREPREWRISRSNELFGLLAIDIGPAVNWVRDTVGVPEFIKTKITAKGPVEVTLLEQNATLKKYIEHAMELISSELPTINSLQELKAGAHYLTADLGYGEEDVWCIVNGPDVYIGRFINNDLTWGLLDGPRVGKYHFNIVRPKWSREIHSCHDLDSGKELVPSSTYDKLFKLIKMGWSFADGDTDCKYLAAAMMVNALSNALPRQLYTLLNGARGTGKSKLLDLVAGADPRLRLVESTSDVQQAYTSAGFRKDMNNCALGAALDEFEDDRNDSHSQQVRAILRDIRGLTNAAEARITRGNAESSEATVYTLKCQIWACAINYLREEADISRFMQIHTVQIDDKSDPHTVVLDNHTEEELSAIRRGISVGLYSRVKEFVSYIEELRTRYSDSKVMDELSSKAGVAVPSRFLDGVIITAAMVKLCGKDPIEYIEEVICAKVSLLTIITSSTHEKDLIDNLLSAKIEYSRPGIDARTTTIRTILSSGVDRAKILELDCGLSYIEVPETDKHGATSISKWLLVMWPDATRTLLSKIGRYYMETPERLKRMGDSSHQAVPYNTARKKVNGLKQFLKPGITSNDITIFDITKLIDEWDNRSNDN